MIEIHLEEEVGVVAQRTNKALQDARNSGSLPSSFPSEVFYMYGHIVEIVDRLQQASQGKDTKVRYPLIVLFTDVPITPSGFGFYGDAKLQIVIVHHTDQNYTAPERLENVFKPILEPIKAELIHQIEIYEQFTRPTQILLTQIRHYFWGSQLNQQNPFNDRLDAIELRDIIVSIKNKYC